MDQPEYLLIFVMVILFLSKEMVGLYELLKRQVKAHLYQQTFQYVLVILLTTLLILALLMVLTQDQRNLFTMLMQTELLEYSILL